MTARMRDPDFRAAQRDGLHLPHIEPVNRLVDHLAGHGRGWLPHIAPVHGGTNARLLWILRDPGPAVADPENYGTGFLCVENDDPTAHRLCDLLELACIDVGDTIPWNAYPWYVNRAPTVTELRAGVPPLRRLLRTLPALEVVLLLGKHAERSWSLLAADHPELAGAVSVLTTRHPGRQAFIGTPEQRAQWRTQQEDVIEHAGDLLRSSVDKQPGPM